MRLAKPRQPAALSAPVSTPSRGMPWVALRPVHVGVVEDSVYVSPDARGLGIGRRLPEAFVTSTEAAGISTIQSHVFSENSRAISVRTAGLAYVDLADSLALSTENLACPPGRLVLGVDVSPALLDPAGRPVHEQELALFFEVQIIGRLSSMTHLQAS